MKDRVKLREERQELKNVAGGRLTSQTHGRVLLLSDHVDGAMKDDRHCPGSPMAVGGTGAPALRRGRD